MKNNNDNDNDVQHDRLKALGKVSLLRPTSELIHDFRGTQMPILADRFLFRRWPGSWFMNFLRIGKPMWAA